VVLVKLADPPAQYRTLEYLSRRSGAGIGPGDMDIYAPIAHRLGMGKLRGEWEDLAFTKSSPGGYRT